MSDAIALRRPDRVPLIPQVEAVPEYYTGITIKEAMYDYRKAGEALEDLPETARRLHGWPDFHDQYGGKLEEQMGFPMAVGANGFAPFDQIGDTMRGTENMMIDALEGPEKVIAACKANGRKMVWIWLHQGVNELMSVDQYTSLYWPTLQKIIVGLVDARLIPVVYCEGSCNTRLEAPRDVPRGKVVCDFENVDMLRAKDILGDVACIAGNVSNALLAYGGPEQVDEYCKRLIRGLGTNGGFMLDAGEPIDNAKVDNLRAMFDSVEKYA